MALRRRPRLGHDVPAWIDPLGARFFVTIKAKRRGANQLCREGIGTEAISAAKKYHDEHRWYCSLILLMPDHAHLLITMSEEHSLATSVGLWKRWLWKKHGFEWQSNFFDHRLRNDESIEQRARYILQNPVRAGLVSKVEDWQWMWRPNAE